MKLFRYAVCSAPSFALSLATAALVPDTSVTQQLELAVKSTGAVSSHEAHAQSFLSAWAALICAAKPAAVVSSVREAVELRPDLSSEIVRTAMEARGGTGADASDQDLTLIRDIVVAGSKGNPSQASEIVRSAVSLQPEAAAQVLASAANPILRRSVQDGVVEYRDELESGVDATRDGSHRRRHHHKRHVRSREKPEKRSFPIFRVDFRRFEP